MCNLHSFLLVSTELMVIWESSSFRRTKGCSEGLNPIVAVEGKLVFKKWKCVGEVSETEMVPSGQPRSWVLCPWVLTCLEVSWGPDVGLLCWISVAGMGILALFLILQGKAFSLSPLSIMLVCRCFIDALYQVEKFPSISSLPRNFYHKWVLDFVKCFFLHQLKWSYDFYSLACRYGRLPWFSSVEPALHAWNKSCLVMVYNSFYKLQIAMC